MPIEKRGTRWRVRARWKNRPPFQTTVYDQELASCLDAMLEEITDRFGKLPAQGQTLFDVHRLRVLAKPYGVIKIDAAPALMVLSFRPNPPVDAIRIIELVQKNRHIKLAGNDKLRIERATKDPKERAQLVRDVLRQLGTPKVEA